MAWHSGKPADSDFLSASVQHIRENFAELEPLHPHIAELVDLTALHPHIAELVDLTTLQPHVAALLDSRIVEMGSNANGTYVRFENGLQVCWLPRLTLTTQLANQARAVWTFPAAFVNTNYSVHITQAWAVGDTPADKVTMAFSQSRSTSNCIPTLASKDYDLAEGESWGVHLVAIGRWK